MNGGISLQRHLRSVQRHVRPHAKAGQTVHRVHIFSIGADPASPVARSPFLDSMRKLGYAENKNLSLVRAFDGDNFDFLDPPHTAVRTGALQRKEL
jgi:hypothetical protein